MEEIFFLVDGVRLEAQACLLAPTLKKNLTRNQRAAAYVRQDYVDRMSPLTHEVLERASIELRVLPNTASGHHPWTAPYPHGNKIIAAAQPRDCDVSVFIDTDTILAEPVNFRTQLGAAEIAACVSDYTTMGNIDRIWSDLYAHFDLDLPKQRVQLLSGRQLTTPPYFNAGVVVFRERQKATPTGIGAQWLETATRLDHEVAAPFNRVNLDQFSLPLLGYLRDKPVKTLKSRYNFNTVANGDAPRRLQSVVHYHRIGMLWARKKHARFTLDCLSELCGSDTIYRMMKAFSVEQLRRQRLKQHLHDFDPATGTQRAA